MRKFFPTFLDEYDPEFLPEEKQQKWYLTKQVVPIIDIRGEVREWEPWADSATASVTDTSPVGYYAYVTLEEGYEYEIVAVISYVSQGNAQIDRIVIQIDRTASGAITDIFRIAYGAGTLLWAKFDGGLTIYPFYHKNTRVATPTFIATYMSTPPPTGSQDTIVTKVLGRRRAWEW